MLATVNGSKERKEFRFMKGLFEMKKKILVLVSLTLLIFTTACFCSFNGLGGAMTFDLTRGSGEVVQKEYEISAADAVEIDGFGVVHFIQGEQVSLMIEAEEGYLDKLEVRVASNRLIIRPQNTWFSGFMPTETPHYYLTLPNVEELTLSGAVKFEADELKAGDLVILCNGGNDLSIGMLEADSLVLKAAGAANWVLDEVYVKEVEIEISGMTNASFGWVEGDSFDLEINGAASATVAGRVETQSVEISGTGSYQAGDLESSDASVKVSGASAIVVWATEDLYLDCDGAGVIEYWGSPRVAQDNAGLTVINSLGDKE